MSAVSKTEIGRAFRKATHKGPAILFGETVETIDMHPGERMMLLVNLAEAVQYHSPAPDLVRDSNGFTEDMSTNLFRFLNTQVSWQEVMVFIHIISHSMDISFTVLGQDMPECREFCRRMREYLRGIV